MVVGPPWKFSATPARVSGCSPTLGEHNKHVFCELLGIPEQEVDRLGEEGVLY
jgi:benzylsuccinate CoA-transferase BbsF subunit